MKDLWLSKEIFTWGLHCNGGCNGEEGSITRAYEIWERASKFHLDAENVFDLSDTVLTLKRSVNQRLRLIEATYHLRDKLFEGKSKHYLEILAHLGIIRHLLFKNLFEIRSKIEHDDAEPPTKERCAELVDIVWYFLKSTDSLVALQRNGFEVEVYDDEGREYGYSLEMDWANGAVEISGSFPVEFVSQEEKTDFIKLKGNCLKAEASISLTGELQPTPIDLLELYRKIFNLYFE